MPAGPYDFELDQGASWSMVVTYLQPGTTNPDGSMNLDGPPVDLTGWTAAMQVREFKGATDILATATCEVDGDAGTITVTLTRAQTTLLPPKTPLVYDLLIIQGTDGVRLIEGQITLDRAVTVVS